jgi:hypothetical protein
VDDVVAVVTAALRNEGHEVEEIRIPSGTTEQDRQSAEVAWCLVPLGGELAVAIGDPALHLRHRRKVVWLLDDGAADMSDLASAAAVFATSAAIADGVNEHTGACAVTLAPNDPGLAARIVGSAR